MKPTTNVAPEGFCGRTFAEYFLSALNAILIGILAYAVCMIFLLALEGNYAKHRSLAPCHPGWEQKKVIEHRVQQQLLDFGLDGSGAPINSSVVGVWQANVSYLRNQLVWFGTERQTLYLCKMANLNVCPDIHKKHWTPLRYYMYLAGVDSCFSNPAGWCPRWLPEKVYLAGDVVRYNEAFFYTDTQIMGLYPCEPTSPWRILYHFREHDLQTSDFANQAPIQDWNATATYLPGDFVYHTSVGGFEFQKLFLALAQSQGIVPLNDRNSGEYWQRRFWDSICDNVPSQFSE